MNIEQESFCENQEPDVEVVVDDLRGKTFEEFTPEQQAEIEYKRQVLSTLAYFIGKDFSIPVELNEPGGGWHWDFGDNIIRIDPIGLLEKPMDHLRYIISHEGGHRRITRVSEAQMEDRQQIGFPFLMNVIEDPRTNNFVADVYPRFAGQMRRAYKRNYEKEAELREKFKGQLGHSLRYIDAGFEYLRLWYEETVGEENPPVDSRLPKEVQEVIMRTREAARDAWLRYPSREEADSSEEIIKQYSEFSYKIIKEKVWPEFKKLIELDRRDQQIQEFLQEMLPEEGEGDEPNIPQELKDDLTPEEQEELEGALKGKTKKKDLNNQEQGGTPSSGSMYGKGQGGSQIEGSEDGGQESDTQEDTNLEGNGKQNDTKAKGLEGSEKQESNQNDKGLEEDGEQGEASFDASGRNTIDLDSLSEELKVKLKEYIDSLPEEAQQELREKADSTLGGLEEDFNEQLKGKLVDYSADEGQEEPEEQPDNSVDSQNQSYSGTEEDKSADSPLAEKEESSPTEQQQWSGSEPFTPKPPSGQYIFGRAPDIEREVSEGDLSLYERERQTVLPLIDKLESDLREIFVARRASGWKTGFKTGDKVDIHKRIQERARGIPPMEGKSWKRREAPKEKDYAITLLVDLSNSMAGATIEETFRSTIVLAEVLSRLSIKTEIVGFSNKREQGLHEYKNFTEDMDNQTRKKMSNIIKDVFGGTDTGWAIKEASERLAKQNATEKFLLVLSDGDANVPKELIEAMENIDTNTDQKVIGLGLGHGNVIDKYFPNNLSILRVEEMAEKLADVIREIIANTDSF